MRWLAGFDRCPTRTWSRLRPASTIFASSLPLGSRQAVRAPRPRPLIMPTWSRVSTPLGRCVRTSVRRASSETWSRTQMNRAEQIRTRQATIRVDLDALEKLDEPTEDDHIRTDALL